MAAALDAAFAAARLAAFDAALEAARLAAFEAAPEAARPAALDAALDAAVDAVRLAALEAALLAALDAALDAPVDAVRLAVFEAALLAPLDAALDAAPLAPPVEWVAAVEGCGVPVDERGVADGVLVIREGVVVFMDVEIDDEPFPVTPLTLLDVVGVLVNREGGAGVRELLDVMVEMLSTGFVVVCTCNRDASIGEVPAAVFAPAAFAPMPDLIAIDGVVVSNAMR